MGDIPNRPNDDNQPEWVRMQVYVPPDFYAVIKARSIHRGASISAEGLRLMKLGLANVKPAENVEADLTALRRYLELHLEPLAFVAATDAAYSREAWRFQLYSARSDTAPEVTRKLALRATQRIQRKLHQWPEESQPFGAQDESEDGDPDEHDGT